MNFSNSDSATNRNISLASGWNLIGHSGEEDFPVGNLRFTNSNGTQYSWISAVANNKLQAYLFYYDNSSANASERKYKYVATADLEMDDIMLRQGKEYWEY